MDSRPDQDAVEAYLDRVFAAMRGLSSSEGDAGRQEMRAHLLALVQSAEQSGKTPEQAVQFALRQFGDPVQIGNRLRRDALKAQNSAVTQRQTRTNVIRVVIAAFCLLCYLIVGRFPWVFVTLTAVVVGIAMGYQSAVNARIDAAKSDEEVEASYHKRRFNLVTLNYTLQFHREVVQSVQFPLSNFKQPLLYLTFVNFCIQLELLLVEKSGRKQGLWTYFVFLLAFLSKSLFLLWSKPTSIKE